MLWVARSRRLRTRNVLYYFDDLKQIGEETEYEVTLAPAGIRLDKAIDTWTFTFTTDAKRELVEGKARSYSEIP